MLLLFFLDRCTYVWCDARAWSCVHICVLRGWCACTNLLLLILLLVWTPLRGLGGFAANSFFQKPRRNLRNTKDIMLADTHAGVVHAYRVLIIHACLRHAHGPLRGQIIKI